MMGIGCFGEEVGDFGEGVVKMELELERAEELALVRVGWLTGLGCWPRGCDCWS